MLCPNFDGACATHIGTRDNNEDYVEVFAHGEFGAVVSADGVGGESWGEQASEAAGQSAMEILRWAAARPYLLDRVDDLRRLIHLAFARASKALKAHAEAEGLRFGLKTTLIVAFVYRNKLAYGYVGDGGLWISNLEGTPVQPLLTPMHAGESGELTGVLGPFAKVIPRTGVVELTPGALVLAATDGLADLIPEPAWDTICLEIRSSESPRPVLNRLLEHCAQIHDASGRSLFNDNMSIGVLHWTP